MELTTRNIEILQVVRDLIQERGISPTISDVADADGVKTPTAQHHLERCEEAGAISRERGRHRSITLTEDGKLILNAHTEGNDDDLKK